MILAVLHADIIYLLCIHSYMNRLCDGIQAAGIHYSALADAFYLLRCLDEITCRNEFAFLFKGHDLQIHFSGFLPLKAVPPLLL